MVVKPRERTPRPEFAAETCITCTTRTYASTKRLIDVIGALLGLTVGAPAIGLAVVAIRLESKGPAIFRQTRVGRFGKPFTLYKLRGMYSDARERFPDLYEHRYPDDMVATLRFHSSRDPRVTRVGRFLRRASLDEVPNLWNVLRGEMSLVGPRPEIPDMLPYYGGADSAILAVKPGVTSLAKVSGRDQLTLAETVTYEVEYVLRRSIWLDLQIIWRTGLTLLRQGWVVN